MPINARRPSRVQIPQQQQQQMRNFGGGGGGGGPADFGGGGDGMSQHITDMKHIRLPPLKRESPLKFEIIILLHVILFNGLQFLHLYRTVWWLPQSFQQNGMNFHLIDVNLIVFTLAITGRRVPYLLMKKIMPANEISYNVLRIAMTCTTTTWLLLTTIRLLQNNPNMTLIHLVYLFWMFFFYTYVFGLKLTPLWEIELLDNPRIESVQGYHHVCTHDPVQIRDECEMLRREFNERVKGVLCLSLFFAYYSAFVPWSFVQAYVSYDFLWVIQHFILCWMYFFGLLVSRAFCPDFSDGLHKAACHLGKWHKLRPNHIPSNSWSSDYLFLPGAIVKHQRELYKAEGILCTAAEPGNGAHTRFQLLFSSSTFPRLLLGFQLATILLTLLILLRTSEWYQLTSLAIIIVVISSHTFIRLGRDFLVVWKLYQAEEIILRQSS